jgi:PAS domain-containing protein
MPGEGPRQAGNADSGGDWASVKARSGLVGGIVRRQRLSTAPLLLAAPALFGLLRLADAQESSVGPGQSLGAVDVLQLASFAGVMGAALLSAIFLIRERARTAAENQELRGRLADLNAALQRSDALLNLRDQRVLAWTSERRKPELIGTLPLDSGAPEDRAAFLAFGRWLMPRSSAALENAIAALRDRGVAFDLVIEAQNGAPLEVQGRKSAAHVVVRFQALSEAQRMQARLKLENQRLAADQENIVGLIDALDMPFWIRQADGRLRWVNRAFARAVDAASPDAAVRESRELLGTHAREAIGRHHLTKPVFQQSISTVIDGDRHVLSVTDFGGGEGSAGIALDRSEIEAIRAELESTVRNHADTLDQLTNAVAIFDKGEKLRFFNQAFQKLWDLDQAFLASAPDNALLIDRLRSEGKIAEQPEWRRWKESLLAAYRAVDSQVHWWHLPDGRTIRVVANPQSNGGVTWIFENLTEKMNLESRYNTAVRVQGETLDNLAEGVAVFGPDGRIRLSNPAFNALLGFTEDLVAGNVHISAIRARCDALARDNPWPGFVAAVTGFD